MKIPFPLLALALAAPSLAAAEPEPRLGDTIRQALARQGEIVTPADRRTIAVKCGLAEDAAPNNISFQNGALHCPDGRIVRDAETRAMSDRIQSRATAYANAAVNSPEVVAVIDAYADEAALKAIRQLRERKR